MKPALDADEFLFREYLTRLNADPAGFMHDEDTVAGLAEVIQARLAEQAFRHARRQGIGFEDETDAVWFILVALSQNPRVVERIVAAESTAIGFARTTIRRWLNSATGRTYAREYVTAAGTRSTRTLMVDVISLDKLIHEPASPDPAFDTEMSLADAIDHTATVLEKISPNTVAPHVFPAVEWLAKNWPQRRSYEAETLNAAITAFPHMRQLHVKAVAAATWGARNKTEHTSLLSGYLRIPNFRPTASDTHRRVLNHYRCQVQPS